MRKISVAVFALAAISVPSHALAQMQWAGRAFVNVGYGIQGGSQEVNTAATRELYGEPLTFSTSQHYEGGTVFDISAGYRVWRNLAIGVGFTRAGEGGSIAVSAAVPHPLFTDRPREISATFEDSNHSQQAVHLMGVWMIPITDKLDVAVSAGPTIFRVKQDVPTDVTVTEPAPTLSELTILRAGETAMGLNAGVDVAYMVTGYIGAGATFRYTYGQVELPGVTDKVTVGGPQLTIGARFRF